MTSELEIIEFIRKNTPLTRKEIIKGIGDDAMILRNGYVLSTDSFFEHVHFDRAYFNMDAVGYHTMAASLSDLAAMGSRPVCALVSLHLTHNITLKEIRVLYEGFQKLANRYKFDIAGGDVVAGPGFGLTITVLGRARRPLERSGACSGQGLYVTEFLGLAEVGRHVMQEQLSQRDFQDSIKKHLYPEPRLKEAVKIRKFASACIDTSDGLSTDAMHLVQESNVKIIIEAEHIPIHSEVGEYCNVRHIDPLDFILSSGEDFELLFTATNVPRLTGLKIFRIGRIEKGKGLYLLTHGSLRSLFSSGYEHLG